MLNPTKATNQPVLLFQNGFEGDSRIIPYKNSDNSIAGKDESLPGKSDWDNDIKKATGGEFVLEYTGGDSTKRFAKIITEPGDTKNKVLQFKIIEPFLASENQIKARVQADIYWMKPGLKEFYQSVDLFVPESINILKNYPEKITWLTLAEFWNNEWWVSTEKHGFRITVGMGKPSKDESDLFFILNAENAGQKEVWNANTYKVKVPVNTWFKIDYYFKEGNYNTGRFYMAITPKGGKKQVVFDVHNATHNTFDSAPDGVTGFNPLKLYTSKEIVNYMKANGKALELYWDNFVLWTNKRPD